MKRIIISIICVLSIQALKAADADLTIVTHQISTSVTEVYYNPAPDPRAKLRQLINDTRKTLHSINPAKLSAADRTQYLNAWCACDSAERFLDNPEFYWRDSDQTIREYLEDYGYRNATVIDIDKVRAYLSNHGLRHVSQIEAFIAQSSEARQETK
jgi:hypothetical protein